MNLDSCGKAKIVPIVLSHRSGQLFTSTEWFELHEAPYGRTLYLEGADLALLW